MGFLEVLGTLDFAIWEGERGAEGEMELISCDQSPAGKLGVQWSGARGTREGWFKLNVASSPKVGEQRTNNLGKAGKGTEGYALRYGTRETADVVLAWFCTQRSLRNTYVWFAEDDVPTRDGQGLCVLQLPSSPMACMPG